MEGGSPDRSLADHVGEHPQRAQILAALRAAPDGLGVADLAAVVGLHPNTVRWHLGSLSDAGLVRSHAAHRGRPGRPSIVYAAATGTSGRDGYRFLAELLASALTGSETGRADARKAGCAWGRHLVQAPPFARTPAGEATDRIRELLDDHGFLPEVVAAGIEMAHCPFRDLVEAHGDVVCTVHEGLIEGALDALGGSVRLRELVAYERPGVCVARLETAAA